MSLFDDIKNYFGEKTDEFQEYRAQNVIKAYTESTTLAMLDSWAETLDPKLTSLPEVEAAYTQKKEELEADGLLTGEDLDCGAGCRMFRGVMGAAATGLTALNEGIGGLISKFIKTDAEKITGVPPSAATIEDLGDTTISEAYQGTVSYLADIIMDALAKSDAPLDDDKRMKVEKSLKSIFLAFGGGAAAIAIPATIADLLHPTKGTNLGRASNLIFEMVGFKPLRDSFLNPLRFGVIEKPLQYHWNELLTPWHASFVDSLVAYGRGHIGDEEFKTMMGLGGVKSDYFPMYKRAAANPSSYFMLNAIGREGMYDPDEFAFWLSDAGYGAFSIHTPDLTEYERTYGLKAPERSQIEFLGEMYARMHTKVHVGDLKSIMLRRFKKGWITQKEFEEYLDSVKVPREDYLPILEAYEADAVWEERSERQKAIEKKFLYGYIDVDELKKQLLALEFPAEWVTQRVQDLTVRKAGKLREDRVKVLTRAQVQKYYELGLIQRAEADRRLNDLGYAVVDISLMLEESDMDIAEVEAKKKEEAEEKKAEEESTP